MRFLKKMLKHLEWEELLQTHCGLFSAAHSQVYPVPRLVCSSIYVFLKFILNFMSVLTPPLFWSPQPNFLAYNEWNYLPLLLSSHPTCPALFLHSTFHLVYYILYILHNLLIYCVYYVFPPRKDRICLLCLL